MTSPIVPATCPASQEAPAIVQAEQRLYRAWLGGTRAEEAAARAELARLNSTPRQQPASPKPIPPEVC